MIIVLAAFAPMMAPYRYDQMAIASRLTGPSLSHWFGTDEFGRDVLSRVLIGASPTLYMGFGATALSLLVGVPLGLVAGYQRGRVDEIIMRSTDVLLSLPPILLGLLVLSVTQPAMWKAILAVGIVYIPPIVRISRSVTLEIAQEEFILAAKARGDGPWYIVVSEILPNAWPPWNSFRPHSCQHHNSSPCSISQKKVRCRSTHFYRPCCGQPPWKPSQNSAPSFTRD